eukprot:14481871-Alexandrium_andersonii.AAC.1
MQRGTFAATCPSASTATQPRRSLKNGWNVLLGSRSGQTWPQPSLCGKAISTQRCKHRVTELPSPLCTKAASMHAATKCSTSGQYL